MKYPITLGVERVKLVVSFRRAAWVVLVGIFFLGTMGPAFSLSRTYMCFFERGSAQLTDRCKLIISEAAEGWRRTQQKQSITPGKTVDLFGSARLVRVDILGNAPDVGNIEGNKRLSLLRALAVADELRHAGVPEELITSYGFGGDRMLVPGEPLDPQNRNVVLILR